MHLRCATGQRLSSRIAHRSLWTRFVVARSQAGRHVGRESYDTSTGSSDAKSGSRSDCVQRNGNVNVVADCRWPDLSHFAIALFSVETVSPLSPKTSNQTMKPTAPWRENLSEFATTPSRGLSLSR